MSSYLTTRSWIRQIDIRIRILSFLFLLPAAAFLADRIILALIIIITIITITLCALWKRFWYTGRLYFISTTIGLVVLSLLFGDQPLTERLLDGLILVVRLNVLISMGIIYALTTNPNEIPQALLKMHIPHRFGILIMLGFRLYPLILERMQTILQSARARGLVMSFSFTSTRFFKNLTLVLPALLLSTLEVGVRLGETMLARGYNPRQPITISPNIRLRLADYLILMVSIGLLLVSIIDPLTNIVWRVPG